jgi:hypothetical protein
VVHGRKLGRELGFRTLNLRFAHWKPAASGIFAVLVHGLADDPRWKGVANLGVRPSLDPRDVNGGRVLLETHCLQWPARLGAEGAYGKIIRVELLHKLHDELRTTASMPSRRASRATATPRAPSSLPPTPKPGGRPRATEFSDLVIAGRRRRNPMVRPTTWMPGQAEHDEAQRLP